MSNGDGKAGQGKVLLNESLNEELLIEEQSQRTGSCLCAAWSVGGKEKSVMNAAWHIEPLSQAVEPVQQHIPPKDGYWQLNWLINLITGLT